MHQRFDNLQALRGLACLIVLATHIAQIESAYGLSFNPLRPLLWCGYASVDYFFVMSGFIMALTCQRQFGQPWELRLYVRRRFWRIFPIYWIALVIATVVFVALSPVSLWKASWPTELVDTLFLLPRPEGVMPRVLPVAWTLSYELAFYTGFMALYVLPRRFAVPALLGWAGLVAALALGGYRADNRFLAHAISPFVAEFAAGCVIALRPVRLTGRAALGVLVVAAGWAAIGVYATFDTDYARLAHDPAGRVAVFGVPMILLTFATAAWERTGGALRWPWLVKVGDASYSIYLLHIPMLLVVWHWTMLAQMSHSRSGHLLWLALMFATALGPGLVLHFLVEAPLLRLGKRSPPRAVDARRRGRIFPVGGLGCFLLRRCLRSPRPRVD